MFSRSRQLARSVLALFSLLVVGLANAPLSWAGDAPTDAEAPASARVIVKFRTDSALLRKQIQSAGDRHVAQAQALGERIGRSLQGGVGVGERTQVVTASGVDSKTLAARLAQESDVEYAVADERRRTFDVPNDPLYAAGVGGNGPAVGQWYLRAPDSLVLASINAEPAWAATTGAPSVVVAVLDTGIRFDHADFKTVAAGGNVLPGYDMVSDVATANDGDGRDADASDPGDWITTAENASGAFKGCGAENSSWHGTQTAGLIGATTNNAVGMASVGRNVRVLPVRVLGKCGGLDSDIIAAMRWAAGLPIDDTSVPVNANPAKVINMSLGGSGTCSQAYIDVFNALTTAGVTVVVAAGNTIGLAVQTPANCPGAVAVAGVRHIGTKVGYSDIGPQIAISAPAGNCVNTSSNTPCLYPILTTANSGATTPVVGGSIYTDSFNYSLGTSFSAPMVTGTVALMLSAQPTLTPANLIAKLKSTARPFPTTGAGNLATGGPVPQCVAPTTTEQDQCYCTTSTCGSGMLDTGAAVLSAANVVAQTSFSPAAPVAGQSVALASTVLLASGRTVASYAWTLTSGSGIAAFSGAANAATATVTTSGAGTFTAQLLVTDSFGATSTSTQTVTVQAAPVGSGGGGALGFGWLAGLAAAVAAVAVVRQRVSVGG